MKIKATVSSLMFALVFFGTQAEAHTFGAQGAGFTAGATHPFLGIDHLLAMVAIGIWAVQLGGAAVWRVPLTFIGVLAASACLAAYGPQPAQLEIAIALSVVILGVLVATSTNLSARISALLVGLLAVAHGYAHGLEIPEAASATAYGLGFIAATALLHAAGIGLGLLAQRNQRFTRWSGLALTIAGIYLASVAA